MPDFSNGAAYVDERFVPIAEAKISILDWGFLHSDATYDVAHVWKGKFFRLEDHIERFLSGMDKLRMSIPQNRDELRAILIDCVRVSGLREAYDRGGETVVVVDARGNLVEGPGFNIFAVNGGTITTPARGVLEGITRRTVMELSAGFGYEVVQQNLSADEARTADEMFVTSTAGGVIPVTKIDGYTIRSGTPGPITQKLQEGYWMTHQDPPYTLKVEYD